MEIQQFYDDHINVVQKSLQANLNEVEAIGRLAAKTIAQGNTIFWCGNGGSAADSQHLAAELVGRFKKDRRALRSVALTTDTSALTCIANDYCFEDVYSRQIEGLGKEGDLLIGITTSGNSENINRAFHQAKQMKISTVALLGKDGGAAKDIADISLIVPSNVTARIQEVHILVGHILCEIIEQELNLA